MVAIAFEVQHGIDHVFEHAWPGECAFFGDMPDEDDRDAGGFGEVDEFGAASAELGDRTRCGFEISLVDHLDGIDHADIGFDFACLVEDSREVGVGEDEEAVGISNAKAIGTHLDLLGGFFGRDIEDFACPISFG